MKLLSFGEVLWDVYPDNKRCIGGAPMNFAAHVVRHGHEAALVSAVGDDELGKETLAYLQQFGIDTAAVRIHPDKPTGRCVVTLDDTGVPSYRLEEDTAWDDITADDTIGGDVLYFGTLSLRSDRNKACLRRLLQNGCFAEIFTDANIREPFSSKESILFALENATILKLSEEELSVVMTAAGFDENTTPLLAVKQLPARFSNLHTVIITRGEKGALAYDTVTDTLCGTPAVKTTVVSTVGAGDSFSAAFLSKRQEGAALSVCLAHAARVAALVVAHTDAVPDYDPQTITH